MEFLPWICGLSWLECFSIVASGLFLLCLLSKKKGTDLPPGPCPFPVVGNLLHLQRQPHLVLHEMRKKYGDIFRVYLGSQLVVVVCGKKYVDEVLSVQSTQFSMRPDFFSAKFVLQGKSFAFGKMNVNTHKQYKSIAMAAIKKTEKSFSKSKLNGHKNLSNGSPPPETFIQKKNEGLEKMFAEEVVILGRKLVNLGKKYNQKHGEETGLNKQYRDAVYRICLGAAANMMCSITFGKRYKPEDQQLDFITDILWELHGIDETITLLNCIPILQKVWKRPINKFIGLNKTFDGLIKMHVAARERLRPKDSERSVIEDTINRNDQVLSDSVTDNLLNMECDKDFEGQWNDTMTASIVGDIFGAGVDTMAVLSMWIIIYFAAFPELKKKVQIEVNHFVNDNHRLPLYSDSNSLPLMMAFITETLRHCSVIPFTVPHSPIQNTTLGGYVIPQGVSLMVSMWSVNHDPEVWEDQEQFWPWRFINDDNTFNKSLADKVMVYGAGRRRCAGVTVSKIQLFALSSTLLHTFNFEAFNKKNAILPEAKLGLSLTPLWVNAKVTEREE